MSMRFRRCVFKYLRCSFTLENRLDWKFKFGTKGKLIKLCCLYKSLKQWPAPFARLMGYPAAYEGSLILQLCGNAVIHSHWHQNRNDRLGSGKHCSKNQGTVSSKNGMLNSILRINFSYLSFIFNTRAGLFNVSTTDLWDGIILCCGAVLRIVDV